MKTYFPYGVYKKGPHYYWLTIFYHEIGPYPTEESAREGVGKYKKWLKELDDRQRNRETNKDNTTDRTGPLEE